MYISDKRLYLTPAGKVSEEPISGGSLLVPAGGELSEDDAVRHGLRPSQADDVGEAGQESDSAPAHLETKPLRGKRVKAE